MLHLARPQQAACACSILNSRKIRSAFRPQQGWSLAATLHAPKDGAKIGCSIPWLSPRMQGDRIEAALDSIRCLKDGPVHALLLFVVAAGLLLFPFVPGAVVPIVITSSRLGTLVRPVTGLSAVETSIVLVSLWIEHGTQSTLPHPSW